MPLRLSADRRFLVDATGQPFFYLADTAWSIVWKGTPDQWEQYLDRRVAQGFSVLQVNLLPWRWELTDVDGNRPFHEGDPLAPTTPTSPASTASSPWRLSAASSPA
jgi:hypothetical protein